MNSKTLWNYAYRSGAKQESFCSVSVISQESWFYNFCDISNFQDPRCVVIKPFAVHEETYCTKERHKRQALPKRSEKTNFLSQSNTWLVWENMFEELIHYSNYRKKVSDISPFKHNEVANIISSNIVTEISEVGIKESDPFYKSSLIIYRQLQNLSNRTGCLTLIAREEQTLVSHQVFSSQKS